MSSELAGYDAAAVAAPAKMRKDPRDPEPGVEAVRACGYFGALANSQCDPHTVKSLVARATVAVAPDWCQFEQDASEIMEGSERRGNWDLRVLEVVFSAGAARRRANAGRAPRKKP